MGIRFNTNVDRADDDIRDYGAGARLYWARDNTSGTGTFTDAAGSQVLVPGQTAYETFDSTGLDGHWYRTRVGDSGGTTFSGWSPPFQAGAIGAYAEVVDLREELKLPDDSKDNLLADYLADASEMIDDLCGRDFYRHPQVSGTEIRTYDLAADADRIVDDILSVTLVEYSLDTGLAFTALAGTDWVLEPSGESPFSVLRLAELGTVGTFYRGHGTVRVTGAFGFASVPRSVRRATLDLAKELYQTGPGGRTVGIDFGRLPWSVQKVVRKYQLRTYAQV